MEIEVESLDKTGGFIGTMWLNKTDNVAALLLEEGLAQVHGYSADQSKHVNQLYAAERAAKQERKNVCLDFKFPMLRLDLHSITDIVFG